MKTQLRSALKIKTALTKIEMARRAGKKSERENYLQQAELMLSMALDSLDELNKNLEELKKCQTTN